MGLFEFLLCCKTLSEKSLSPIKTALRIKKHGLIGDDAGAVPGDFLRSTTGFHTGDNGTLGIGTGEGKVAQAFISGHVEQGNLLALSDQISLLNLHLPHSSFGIEGEVNFANIDISIQG